MSFLRGSQPRLLYWMCFPRSLSASFHLIQISACMSPPRCLGWHRGYPPQSPSLSCFCFNCFTALISDIVFLFSYLLPVSRYWDIGFMRTGACRACPSPGHSTVPHDTLIIYWTPVWMKQSPIPDLSVTCKRPCHGSASANFCWTWSSLISNLWNQQEGLWTTCLMGMAVKVRFQTKNRVRQHYRFLRDK